MSGKSQVDGDGFNRQRAAVEAWAAVNGVDIVDEYLEKGESGAKSWGDRPAFAEMVGRLLSNGVKTIVVENLTRVAREFVVQDAILTYLASKGLSLISADTGEDVVAAMSEDPARRAMVQMMAVFSEYEKRLIVAKLKAARERKGTPGGRKPYGHREGERQVISKMIKLRESGFGFKAIAEELNEQEIPTRTGKQWAMATVRQILNREMEAA